MKNTIGTWNNLGHHDIREERSTAGLEECNPHPTIEVHSAAPTTMLHDYTEHKSELVAKEALFQYRMLQVELRSGEVDVMEIEKSVVDRLLSQ